MKTVLQWLLVVVLVIVGVPAVTQSFVGGLFLLAAAALATPPVWNEIQTRTNFRYRGLAIAALSIVGMVVWVNNPEFQKGAAEAKAKQDAQRKAALEITSNADADSGNSSTSEKIEIVEEDAGRGNLTGPQINAVRSAKQYLSMTGFSRDGLIQQLSSDAGEGYSVSDATVAVDSLNVDWNENAARSARQYLEMSGFSCKGLIEQLSSSAGDKYTTEQATYGARQAGAC